LKLRVLAVATLACAVVANLTPVSASSTPDAKTWTDAATSGALSTALRAHGAKIPAEFLERLSYVRPDGSLQVMVALTTRNDGVEDFVTDNTVWLKWYGDAPRFWGAVTQDQLIALLRHPSVSFVEPDYKITHFLATSTVAVGARPGATSGGVWSYDAAANALRSEFPQITADEATGKGVTVAITDSGIDRTFYDFGGFSCVPSAPYEPCQSRIRRAVTTEHIIGGSDLAEDSPTTELASGHGTHVAGIVAGNAYYGRSEGADATRYGGDGLNFGIAPQADLVSVKNGDTLWAGLSTMGLQWTLDNAAEYGIKVSNNSWGCVGGCSFNGNSATAQTLKSLYEAGVVVVFAAGNDAGGENGAAFSGNAQSPYVLGVANYNDSDSRLATSSSRGDKANSTLYAPATWTPGSEPTSGTRRPDLGAPGTSIWSAGTLTGGAASGIPRLAVEDTGLVGLTVPYRLMSGTSMAAPHVAGAAAVLFSACEGATALDVMRALMAGANPATIKKSTGAGTAEPFEVGYGALNVRASLEWLASTEICAWAQTPSA
jgi:subtilisin family serine protease